MIQIPQSQILNRLRADNPWWESPERGIGRHKDLTPRKYLEPFQSLVTEKQPNRAVVLMGPRRVGKTVLVFHAIQRLLDRGQPPSRIAYLSVDHPLFNDLGLEDLVNSYLDASDTNSIENTYLFFDEVQYRKDWEVHLKALVDRHPEAKFIATGSAAAALRLASAESGAGRFSEFLLPPLSFDEYLTLRKEPSPVQDLISGGWEGASEDSIIDLNQRFERYINIGGYPEVALSPILQESPDRIKTDIIDKVLLRDLPSLYGIQDIQELNHLFTTLAYSTGQETSLEGLTKSSGVSKTTVKKYIHYLEAAFLVKTIHRIDINAKRFKRVNFFKVHLTNPSMRTALFSHLSANDAEFGHLVETALFSQWFHGDDPLRYARWDKGRKEVDLVELDNKHDPTLAVEVKWSDNTSSLKKGAKALSGFCKHNDLSTGFLTTRTLQGEKEFEGVPLRLVPASLFCLWIGFYHVDQRVRNLLISKE